MANSHLTCPDCGREMMLKRSKYGPFYGCVAWPQCEATHGAHPDGRPLGIPADKATREARMRAHEAFDGWRKAAGVRRPMAYRELAKRMEMTEDEAHIGRFDIDQCERVVRLFSTQGTAPALDSAGTPALDSGQVKMIPRADGD